MYQFSDGFRLVSPFLDSTCFKIGKIYHSLQLIDVLAQKFYRFTSKHTLDTIYNGRVLINRGVVSNPKATVEIGDELKIIFHRHEPEVLNQPIRILYSNEQLLVVNKPCSIPVHPVGRFKKNSLIEILKHEHPHLVDGNNKLYIVHRLDRQASGLLLIARNKETAKLFNYLLLNGFIHKQYLARVKGVIPFGVIYINRPINKTRQIPTPLYNVGVSNGKTAVTIVERLRIINECNNKGAESDDQWAGSDEGYRGAESIVSCRPVTGRTHQIRVHLNAIGHPIVNDVKYGGRAPLHQINQSPLPFLINHDYYSWCTECQTGRRDVSTVAINDLSVHCISLHSWKYSCNHPKWEWSFQAPPPDWIDIQ